MTSGKGFLQMMRIIGVNENLPVDHMYTKNIVVKDVSKSGFLLILH